MKPAAVMRVRLARPQLGEEELAAVRRVFDTGMLTNGANIPEFERAFAEMHDVPYAVAVANGTVALTAMLLAHGIGPGDEVIVPAMTFISTATAVVHAGATPVFADILEATFDLDPGDVPHRITPRTKAIVAVHYAGQPAAMPELAAIAAGHGILLLEDAAQAHGARLSGRPAGSWGASGMFSFSPTKNITTGEGGMVVTADDELAGRLCLLRNHGMTTPYRHDVLGYNWRLTEMQAAIGLAQLARLPEILRLKRRNAALMTELLNDVPHVQPPVTRPGAEPVHSLYTVLFDPRVDRDRVQAAMLAHGVEVKRYYPAIHVSPVFPGEAEFLPVADSVDRRMLSLPIHAHLGREDIQFVAATLAKAIGQQIDSTE